MYKKSLYISESVLGEEHPDTAVSYNNLAVLYRSQGKYKAALDYYVRAYKIFKNKFGSGHPQLLIKRMVHLFRKTACTI